MDLEAFDIVIDEGLTVGDDYPRNQRNMFAASNVYGLSGIPLPAEAEPPDERFAPIADGQHTGLSGLPVQDEVYHWVSDNGLTGFETATQSVAVSTDPGDGRNLTFDYSEAATHALQIRNVPGTGEIEGITSIEYDDVDPDDVTVTNRTDASQIVVSFAPDSLAPDQSPTVQFDLVWAAADPVEGLNVQRPNEIDYETDHRLVLPDGDQVRDNFVTFEAGATGISYDDVDNANGGFLGEPADEVDLTSVADAEDAASGTVNDGSFLVWEDQVVTLETEERGQTVDIYETAVDGDGTYTLGQKLPDDVLGFDDTAPGRIANLHAANLSAGEQYFVTFGGDTNSAVVLDVKPLNLKTSLPETTVPAGEFDESFEVAVSSDDTTGEANVEAWFYEAGTDGVGDVVHVERGQLTGSGDRTIEIVPQVDLTSPERGSDAFLGKGEYYAEVLHAESGVTVATESFELGPGAAQFVPADDVQIVSPSLEEPDTPGIFDRGDIVPVELAFGGGNVGTVTFGDRDDQNVELNATVYDANGDGSATVYLNTYQVGHGRLHGGERNRPTWIAPEDFEDRQHGFFTNPANNDAQIIGEVTAHPEIDIYGGSQGGAVLSPGKSLDGFRYDLHATGGFEPFTVGDNRTDINAVEIEQRSTDGFTVWTAPGDGENAIDPTTAGDIEDGIQAGTITQLETETVQSGNLIRRVYNGTVAENDILLIQVDASGTAGVLHEAVLRNESLAVDEFLRSTIRRDVSAGNHLVTGAFREALAEEVPRVGESLLRYQADLDENVSTFQDRFGEGSENVGPENPARVRLDLGVDRVVTDLDGDGTLQQYFLPYKLVPGEDLLAPGVEEPFVAGLTMDTAFELEPGGGTQADVDPAQDPSVPESVNPPLDWFSTGLSQTDELDYVAPAVRPDGLVDGVLEVPPRSNWTVSGTSTMAPGTTLDIRMVTATAEETPFLKTAGGVQTTAQAGGQQAAWSFEADFSETRDGVAIQGGTEFSLAVARTGTGFSPLVTPDATTVPGAVLPAPAVETFEVADQRLTGGTVVVSAYEANRNTTIQLRNAAGDVVGESGVLARNTRHETLPISLDTVPEGNQEITAVATVVRPESGEPLANRTASVQVEREVNATLLLSDLEPQAVSTEPGAEVPVSVAVENTGDLEGTRNISLTADGDAVTSESVTLGGGETTTVTLAFEAPAAPGTYTYSVASGDDGIVGSLTVQTPATFRVLTLTPAETSVEVGTMVSVSSLVQNAGDVEGTREVVLSVGDRTDNQSTTLAGSGSETASFSLNTSELGPGTYTYSVSADGDSQSGSLTVRPEPARVQVSGLEPLDTAVEQGETVPVSLTVTNQGGAEANQTVTLEVDGVVRTEPVTLASGAEETVSFDLDTSSLELGDYTFSAASENDSMAGLLTVTEPSDDGNDSLRDTADGDGAGLGVVAAVLALLGGATLALRRRRAG